MNIIQNNEFRQFKFRKQKNPDHMKFFPRVRLSIREVTNTSDNAQQRFYTNVCNCNRRCICMYAYSSLHDLRIWISACTSMSIHLPSFSSRKKDRYYTEQQRLRGMSRESDAAKHTDRNRDASIREMNRDFGTYRNVLVSSRFFIL
jgi:hypothetical protein